MRDDACWCRAGAASRIASRRRQSSLRMSYHPLLVFSSVRLQTNPLLHLLVPIIIARRSLVAVACGGIMLLCLRGAFACGGMLLCLRGAFARGGIMLLCLNILLCAHFNNPVVVGGAFL